MNKLILGVLLWSFMHFIPAGMTGLRTKLTGLLGENGWKGVFALTMVAAIWLMVSGWKSTVPETLYLPPDWGRHACALLVLVGLVLFNAPYPPNNFKRLLRHPQLTGMACWGVGHLLANGDSRSLVLFGGLTAWAIVQILLINRRDGTWQKPAPAPRKNDVILVLANLAIFAGLAFAHPWFTGVNLY